MALVGPAWQPQLPALPENTDAGAQRFRCIARGFALPHHLRRDHATQIASADRNTPGSGFWPTTPLNLCKTKEVQRRTAEHMG